MQNKIEAVEAKVQECIALAERKFCVAMPKVDVRFDLKGRDAGIAGKRGAHFYLRFNIKHMALGGKTWDHILNDVVPHEVAHTVCQSNPRVGRNHNTGWKTVCLALGGNGKRCYSAEDAPEAVAQANPYVYLSTNGSEISVTKRIHNKIQRGSAYRYRGGKGELNQQCAYNYMAAPTVTKTTKLVITETTHTPRKKAMSGLSKADQIRNHIAMGYNKAECIEFGINVLGMKRTLARTYVNNNWK